MDDPDYPPLTEAEIAELRVALAVNPLNLTSAEREYYQLLALRHWLSKYPSRRAWRQQEIRRRDAR